MRTFIDNIRNFLFFTLELNQIWCGWFLSLSWVWFILTFLFFIIKEEIHKLYLINIWFSLGSKIFFRSIRYYYIFWLFSRLFFVIFLLFEILFYYTEKVIKLIMFLFSWSRINRKKIFIQVLMCKFHQVIFNFIWGILFLLIIFIALKTKILKYFIFCIFGFLKFARIWILSYLIDLGRNLACILIIFLLNLFRLKRGWCLLF